MINMVLCKLITLRDKGDYMEQFPSVTIGCPISNRSYVIKRYLEGILNLDYPKDKIRIYFLVNNCNDGTDMELKNFKRSHEKKYLNITLEKYKMPYREDKRVSVYRNETYRRLAELRNYVLSKIDTDYYFSVDSDIILNPNSLTELLNAKKDIIAGVVNNDVILRPYNNHPSIRTNLLNIKDGKYRHIMDFPLNEIIEVDCTGAVYLLTKEVCQNVKYDMSPAGEDIPFCKDAQEKGYKLYAHTGLWHRHIMCEYQEYCIQNKCQNPCVSYGGNKVYQYKYLNNSIYPNLVCCPKVIKGENSLLKNP